MVERLAHYRAVRVWEAGRNEIHPGMRLSKRLGYGNDGLHPWPRLSAGNARVPAHVPQMPIAPDVRPIPPAYE